MQSTPIKIITKDIFTIEIFETLSGSIAYKFYCRDIPIYQNNNFYIVNKDALNNDDRMFHSIASMIILEERFLDGCKNKRELEFLLSNDFCAIKKLVLQLS